MFHNKVVVITGGSSGIGFAAAKLFLQRGGKAVIASRSAEKGHAAVEQLQRISPDVLFVPTDVSRSADVCHLMNKTVEHFGRMDFAFNNAANDEVPFTASHELSEADFDSMISTIFKGVWLGMKEQVRWMMNHGGGAIVNTASVDALLCSAGTAVYAAGKSGVIALTKSMAQEYGRYGIRINSLCPGAIRTPMLERKFVNLPPADRERVEQQYARINALGRIGAPEEAAEVVLWLFSEQSSYITGQNIIADGGVRFI